MSALVPEASVKVGILYGHRLASENSVASKGTTLTLELDPQQVDAVGFTKHVVQPMRYLNPQLLDPRWNQGRWAADDHPGTQLLQTPDIRSRHRNVVFSSMP